MTIPPGLPYLARFLPNFLLYTAATYSILFYLRTCKDGLTLQVRFDISLLILALSSRPLICALKYLFINPYIKRREAEANGARLPPWMRLRSGGPRTFVGALLELGRGIEDGYPGEALFDWVDASRSVEDAGVEEVGNAVLVPVPGEDVFFTVEPEHIKAILATQFSNFEKGAAWFDQMDSLLGTGIFNTDGDMWKWHRSMTRPFFTKERVSDFDIYDRNCTLALSRAKDRLEKGYSIDFQDLASRFTLDAATEFLCGQNVASLSISLPYPPSIKKQTNSPEFCDPPENAVLAAFGQGQARAFMRTVLATEWPLGEFWNDQVKPVREVTDRFSGPLLERALKKWEAKQNAKGDDKGHSDGKEDESLLDHLVNHTQDPKVLKDQFVNLMVAGRDSTACLLTFCCYMLCENPDVEMKLREEIFNNVGPTGRLTHEHVRDMKYTRAFINEVLRLYPPVPLANRSNIKATLLPSSTGLPFYIPERTNCVWSVMYIHRRTDLWGPDAQEFDPMRFIDERHQKYLVPNPYIFCPFNAGPRICLGQQFAYHEATFFLVKLLQNFTGFQLDAKENLPPNPEWKLSSDRRSKDTVRPASYLTMFVKGGLWMKMKPYIDT